MPVTRNNVKQATKTTGRLIGWIIVIWCIFAVVGSLLFIILANTVLKSKFVNNAKTNPLDPMVNNAINMELKTLNITFAFIIIFHLIVGGLIHRQLK